MARELGENMSKEELRAMIDEFDLDNDGESESYQICKIIFANLSLFLIRVYLLYVVSQEEFMAIMTGDTQHH